LAASERRQKKTGELRGIPGGRLGVNSPEKGLEKAWIIHAAEHLLLIINRDMRPPISRHLFLKNLNYFLNIIYSAENKGVMSIYKG